MDGGCGRGNWLAIPAKEEPGLAQACLLRLEEIPARSQLALQLVELRARDRRRPAGMALRAPPEPF
ncbi:MAG: hypothetical protein QGG14_07325 [Planctomycetota bacterium]|jgi:hypothetical protein|nr:hypothetical protein [Planctomycetota bacterium]